MRLLIESGAPACSVTTRNITTTAAIMSGHFSNSFTSLSVAKILYELGVGTYISPLKNRYVNSRHAPLAHGIGKRRILRVGSRTDHSQNLAHLQQAIRRRVWIELGGVGIEQRDPVYSVSIADGVVVVLRED